jgi:hypothetical protein
MKGKTVVDELEMRIREMKAGTYTKSSGAILITRDQKTGILTFSYPGLDVDDGMKLFAEAAEIRGFVPKDPDDAAA